MVILYPNYTGNLLWHGFIITYALKVSLPVNYGEPLTHCFLCKLLFYDEQLHCKVIGL